MLLKGLASDLVETGLGMHQGSGPKASGAKTNASMSSQNSCHPEISEGPNQGLCGAAWAGSRGEPLTVSVSLQKQPYTQVPEQRHRQARHMRTMRFQPQRLFFISFSTSDSFSKQKKTYLVCKDKSMMNLLNSMS